MSLMYGHLDRKEDDETEAIRERAEEVRREARNGDL